MSLSTKSMQRSARQVPERTIKYTSRMTPAVRAKTVDINRTDTVARGPVPWRTLTVSCRRLIDRFAVVHGILLGLCRWKRLVPGGGSCARGRGIAASRALDRVMQLEA